MSLTRGERFKDARTVYNQHGKQSMRIVEGCTDVSASVITYLESDGEGRNVGYPNIVALAKHYGVSTDFLLGLTNDPYPIRSVIDDLSITPAVAERFLLRKKQNCSDCDVVNKYNRVLENDDVWILLGLIHGYMTAVKADSIYWELVKKYDGDSIDDGELCKMLLEKAESYRETDIDMCDFLEAKASITNWDTKDSLLSLGMDEFDLAEIWSLRIARQLEDTLHGIRRGEEHGND